METATKAQTGTIENWLSMQGEIERLAFFFAGLALALTKYFVDVTVAGLGFGRSWPLENYWAGKQIELWTAAFRQDRSFYAAMLFLSIPFVWAGIVLTVRRLRSAGLPLWLASLFFVPVLNLALFLLLSTLPRADRKVNRFDAPHRPADPVHTMGGRTFAISVTALFGALLTAFDVYALGIYGVGLFVGLPFCLGMIGALLHGFRGVIGCKSCVATAVLSVTTVAGLLLLMAFEGIVCLLMAAPIWVACAALGGVVGFYVQQYARDQKEAALVIVGLALIAPVIMGAEALLRPPPEITSVRTVVEIEAAPDEVWRRVIAFPRLPEPTEYYFKMGVAYPTDATIVGRGVGAERRCNFSTGTFVEPIEVWDEPHRLKFSVTQNPPPLREFSFHKEIHPPHLDGFLVSRSGQFRLTPLDGGGTLLEGTTWYQNDMAPSAYWRLWSDAIIHRIHLRVLRHIERLSETEVMADVP